MKKISVLQTCKMKIIGLSVFLLGSVSQINAQVASVEQTLSGVRQNVDRVNQLAENHDIYKSVELLKNTRRDFDSYLSHYFDDEYRAARKENQAYVPVLNLKFSSKLTASYWEERVKRSQNAIKNAKEAYAARNYQRTLNAQDEVWAYLKTAYTVAKTIKDVAENIVAQNYVEAAKSAYDGANDFIGNYEEIEEARLQIINTERYEIEVQTLIKRAERMEETNWQLASYMRAWEQDVDDFYRLVDRFNTRVNTLGSESQTEGTESDYSWNDQPFLSQIEELGDKFKTNNQSYDAVKKQIENIISQAENQKEEVEKNIHATNSSDKADKLNSLEEDFDEFYNLAFDVIDDCYRVSQSKTASQSQNQSVGVSNQNVARQNQTSQKVTANAGTGATNNTGGIAPGKQVPNTFYHSYWSDSKGNKIKFRQNGLNVEIEGAGTGQIQNGVLIYSYKEQDGTRRKNEYRLLDDGFKMEVKKEWSDMMIKDHLTVLNNFTAPSKEKINDFRKTNGNYITSVLSYAGSTMARYGDKDQDQVPDEFDVCPDTPQGLTVSNGGVDITGCVVKNGAALSAASATSNTETTSAQNTGESRTAQNNLISSTSAESQNIVSSSQNTNSASGQNTAQENTASSKTGNATPANSSLKPERIGYAVNKNQAGASAMCRVPVYRLMENETLVFKLLSGVFQKFYIRWSGKSFEEVLFEKTTDVVYSTAQLMAQRPEKAMFLDFWLNQYSDVSCSMEAWVLPAGVAIPKEWNIPSNPGVSGGSAGNTAAGNFYDLIKKADEAFNRKYWNENGGVNSSSNPKQESLDLLRKCDPFIAKETNIQQKYSMIKTLSAKYAEYARRVFAYSAKSDFMQSAGGLLSKYGSQADAVSGMQQKSVAYRTIAEGWRDLTKAATWGDHQYNKMYCDKESKKYYDLALREDRNNEQLQKTVEKINAPKKPVPAAVSATPAIPEEKWAKAENMRNVMLENDDDFVKRITETEKPKYLAVGKLSLNAGVGKVQIMHSGTDEWQDINTNSIEVYPGDKIKTGADAVNVSFVYDADKSFLAVKPDAIVTIFEDQLLIERGNVFVRVVKKGREFLVITPTAVTGPRGTEFSVSADAGKTKVNLYEGIIEMRSGTGISFLIPGESASVAADDEIISEKFNIQTDKMQNWNWIEDNYSAGKVTDEKGGLFKNVTGGFTVIGKGLNSN
ncbi:MAG: hypothetical protein EP310_07065 [Bacteroidetes bacterium]|nr:MAG: hypothetical protein EP310_07065 [Bacteroidota bacterium]